MALPTGRSNLDPSVRYASNADDWLDSGVLRRLDEIDNPVEDAVICDGYRRLTIGCRGRNHILDPGRTVEHRILGVDVEVCE